MNRRRWMALGAGCRHRRTHISPRTKLLVIGLAAVAAALAGPPDQGPAGEADSRHAARDIDADTDPNSAFWRGAPGIFFENDPRGNPVPGYRTEIRSRWTDHNLYFLFICPYEQLNLKPDPVTATETNELWKWDVAEVFIGSDFRNIRRYKEFELSPQGERIDLDIDLDTPHHEDGWVWNSGFRVSARIDAAAKTWYGFMGIPYSAVDGRPAAAGNLLRINFFRSQGARPNRKALAWRPPRQNTFHAPEAFGLLRLTD
jgi:hypothetical protein